MTSSNDASGTAPQSPRALPGRRFPPGPHHPHLRGKPRHRPGHRPRAARDGANIVLMAKTGQPHAKLEGTVYSAAEQIEAAGGQALPLVGDVRNDADVAGAVAAAVERFGGIDIVINNASAIDLSTTDDVDMKRYDLMQDINVRGTFLLSKLALPALRESGRRPDPDALPAAEPGPQVGRPAPGLHHGQVRHEPDHPGPGRGTEGRRHQRELAVALHPDQHGRHPQHARRRQDRPGRPRPRNHGGRGPRGPDQQQRDSRHPAAGAATSTPTSRSSRRPASRTSPRTAWAPRKTS